MRTCMLLQHFTRAKNGNHQSVHYREEIKKTWYIHTLYSILKKNEILSCPTHENNLCYHGKMGTESQVLYHLIHLWHLKL